MPRRNHCPEWVHPDGRLLVIGEGAHPLVVSPLIRAGRISHTHTHTRLSACSLQLGTIYGLGMSTGDAAALGRIFSHLSRKDQIDGFLSAVQEVRKERVEDVMRRAAGNIFAVSIPPSVAAAHDREMDRQVERGLQTLRGKRRIQPQTSEQLVAAVEDIYAYDPEDEADDWWVRWGKVESRVARWSLADGEGAVEVGGEAEVEVDGEAEVEVDGEVDGGVELELESDEEEKEKEGAGTRAGTAALGASEQVTVVAEVPL